MTNMAMQELILITVAALVALAVSVAADLAVVVLVDSKIFSIHSLAAVVAVLLIQMHQDKAPIYNIQFN